MAIDATFTLNRTAGSVSLVLSQAAIPIASYLYLNNRLTSPALMGGTLADTEAWDGVAQLQRFADLGKTLSPTIVKSISYDYQIIKRRSGMGPQEVELNVTVGGLTPPGMTRKVSWNATTHQVTYGNRVAVDLEWADFLQYLECLEGWYQSVLVY